MDGRFFVNVVGALFILLTGLAINKIGSELKKTNVSIEVIGLIKILILGMGTMISIVVVYVWFSI